MITIHYYPVTRLGEHDSVENIKTSYTRRRQFSRMSRKRILRRDFWLKGNGRYIIASSLIVLVLLGVVQVFVPRGVSQENTSVGDRADWLRLATNAWKYFQPGQGVDSTSGLHKAGLYYPYFTDWDLGLYIQAIIDAEKLGIVSKTGPWGADERFETLVRFLETRELTSSGVPYLWYVSATGQPRDPSMGNACDSGKLLVALQNLRAYRPEFASRINSVVYNRTNYEPLKQAVDTLRNSVNIYDYYVARGFAGFWPERFTPIAESIINSITSAPTVTDQYGVTLPISKLTGETLLHSVFELAPNAKLMNLTQKFYLAHEARYTATGKFVAFSEGNTGLDYPSYVYEWVVYPTGQTGQTWVLKGTSPEELDVSIPPIIYLKVAVGLMAINNTQFTRSMVSYVESQLPAPSTGYVDGIDENGRKLTTTIDKTNGLIIGAAEYAIRNLPLPTPTPTPTPTASSPAPTPTPTVTISPSPSPSSTPTHSPSTNPASPSASPSPSPAENATPTLAHSPSSSQTPSPSTTASPNPSLSPSETATSSPSSSPSLSPSFSPSEGSSPTNNDNTFGSVETIAIVVIAVVGCLIFASLLLIRRRKKQ